MNWYVDFIGHKYSYDTYECMLISSNWRKIKNTRQSFDVTIQRHCHTATANVRKLFQNLRIFLQKFREIDGLLMGRVKIVNFALFWVKISKFRRISAPWDPYQWKQNFIIFHLNMVPASRHLNVKSSSLYSIMRSRFFYTF